MKSNQYACFTTIDNYVLSFLKTCRKTDDKRPAGRSLVANGTETELNILCALFGRLCQVINSFCIQNAYAHLSRLNVQTCRPSSSVKCVAEWTDDVQNQMIWWPLYCIQCERDALEISNETHYTTITTVF